MFIYKLDDFESSSLRYIRAERLNIIDEID